MDNEIYNKCTQKQKDILDRMFWYLGFNEVSSFDEFIDFMFKNARYSIAFEHIINHSIAHVVKSFWNSYPEYRDGYIKYFWLKEDDMISHMSAGSDIELDPKGLVRHFVKNNFKSIVQSKDRL